MDNKIKVCLVDDQTLIREGIKSLLNFSDKVAVVAECSDGSELAQCIAHTSPEVILLDLSMPIMNGIDTLQWMKAESIDIPVIILTTFDDHDWILQSIQAGAKGFLLKDVSLETLVEAIESVHQGNSHIQPAITERLLSSLSNQNITTKPLSKTEALTEKDKKDIVTAAEIGVDYLAVSFPRSGAGLNYARQLAEQAGCNAFLNANPIAAIPTA